MYLFTVFQYDRLGQPVEEDEYNRQCTECTFKRTVRDKDCLGSEDTQFDMYTNDMWHVRHLALDRFAQAARKVQLYDQHQAKLKLRVQ